MSFYNCDLLYALFNIEKALPKLDDRVGNPFKMILFLFDIECDFYQKDNNLAPEMDLMESIYVVWNESRNCYKSTIVKNLDVELEILDNLDKILRMLKIPHKDMMKLIKSKERRY